MPDSLDRTEELLDATGSHPYVRATLRHAGDGLRTWLSTGAAVWTARHVHTRAPVVRALGEPEPVAGLLAEIWPLLPHGVRFMAPAGVIPLLREPVRFTPKSRFEFRWTTQDPPEVPGEDDVQVLSAADDADITELLRTGNPTAEMTPGDPAVRRWAGVRDAAGRLVTVAADTSGEGTGHLSSVATAVDRRGRGLGGALAARLTRWLVAEFGLCSLGLYADNDPARRLYARLGYDGHMQVAYGTLG